MDKHVYDDKQVMNFVSA